MIENYAEKMASGPFYFENTFEDIALRTEPGEGHGKTFAKFKGGTEYPIKPDSNLIYEALCTGRELTKEEYENY